MAIYLGSITIRNHYVNFKPLYEYKNNQLYFLTQEEREELLPESHFQTINFYLDEPLRAEDMFFSDSYCLLEFEEQDLEPNFGSDGQRNLTGYKLDIMKMKRLGKLKSLSDINHYYVLSNDDYEGSYRSNPTLTIKDSHVYDGLEVVIPLTDSNNEVIGPLKVEWIEKENKHIVRTGLNKYILQGYRFPASINHYEKKLGRVGEEKSYIYLNKDICEKIYIDVISKEELVADFKKAINRDSFVDGKLDLDNINDLISEYKESLYVGNIPQAIQEKRFDDITTLLTDEKDLNETFRFISETITVLLEKYHQDKRYRELIEEWADRPEFMGKIQRFAIINEKIDQKQVELDRLEKEVQEKLEEGEKRKEEAEILQKYDVQIQEKIKKIEELESRISEFEKTTNLIKKVTELKEKEAELEDIVKYNKRRAEELGDSVKTLEKNIDEIFSNSSQKALSFSFDGMLTNRMLQQAAAWENQQKAENYLQRINVLKNLPVSVIEKEALIEKLVAGIKKYRPSYDRNTILNILICYTQGFLTVFSGEPGTGKTSICQILAAVLGLTMPGFKIPQESDGYSASRFIPISVEKGWTTKRDFIGYYNPITKTFDQSNRKIFDAFQVLDLEAKGNSTGMPFMMLLDEANLSPMEYYWADFMNICDTIDHTSNINLGDKYSFDVPDQLRFVATINNDHTTEALSPRLIDRAWTIKLPKVKAGTLQQISTIEPADEIVSWNALRNTFGVKNPTDTMSEIAREIYIDLINKFKLLNISINPRTEIAIKKYWSVAQQIFENDATYGTDASIVALDYAIAQRILPHIDGSGANFQKHLEEIASFLSEKNLRISADILLNIINKGKDSMQYFQFFS